MSVGSSNTEYESLTIEDGVVLLRWPRDGAISGPAARRAVDDVNRLCAGTYRPMLVDMATTKSVAREARAAFSQHCMISRLALLGHSPVDRVIANFTFSVSTVPMPTRFFTDRNQALAYLREGRDDPAE